MKKLLCIYVPRISFEKAAPCTHPASFSCVGWCALCVWARVAILQGRGTSLIFNTLLICSAAAACMCNKTRAARSIHPRWCAVLLYVCAPYSSVLGAPDLYLAWCKKCTRPRRADHSKDAQGCGNLIRKTIGRALIEKRFDFAVRQDKRQNWGSF